MSERVLRIGRHRALDLVERPAVLLFLEQLVALAEAAPGLLRHDLIPDRLLPRLRLVGPGGRAGERRQEHRRRQGERPQFGQNRPQGAAAMAQDVLLVGAQLGERAAVGKSEDGVVAEAARAARAFRDGSVETAFGEFDASRRVGQSHHGPKGGLAPRRRHAGHLPQELRAIIGVRAAGTGPAGGEDARRAAEDVDLQARVVGKSPRPARARRLDGLLFGVAFEGLAVLDDLGNARIGVERRAIDAAFEKPRKLRNLVDVARREDESNLAGHGLVCYHFRVKATGLGLLLLLAVAACTRNVQPEDDSDPAIKARVEIALHGRKDIDSRYISLDVASGVVTISGVVPAPEQIRLIERVVKRTPGVDQVMNNVVVQE